MDKKEWCWGKERLPTEEEAGSNGSSQKPKWLPKAGSQQEKRKKGLGGLPPKRFFPKAAEGSQMRRRMQGQAASPPTPTSTFSLYIYPHPSALPLHTDIRTLVFHVTRRPTIILLACMSMHRMHFNSWTTQKERSLYFFLQNAACDSGAIESHVHFVHHQPANHSGRKKKQRAKTPDPKTIKSDVWNTYLVCDEICKGLSKRESLVKPRTPLSKP